MKLLIIGVPDYVLEEQSALAVGKLAEELGIDVHCQMINTKSFEVATTKENSEEDLVRKILKDLITVCLSSGNNVAMITANFMRLIHDDKITLKEIKLIRKHSDVLKEMTKKHRCPCLNDLLISGEIILCQS